MIGIAVSAIALLAPCYAADTDQAPNVTLESAKVGPRALEPLTERSVLRDYSFAWASLARALDSNSVEPLDGPFAGSAAEWLRDTVADQRRNGLSARYLNQTHRLEAVFYAPEGDLIELHDTADYDLQLRDGDKNIYNRHVTRHYVVLMTPSADRWVVRQLQAVPQF